MKNIISLSIILSLSIFFNGFSADRDSLTDSIELVTDINSNLIEADSLLDNSPESSLNKPSKPAGYGQLFMFGFLILGAVLVVWKLKGKDWFI